MNFQVEDRGLQYAGAARIEGSLVFVERVRDVGYDELVEICDPAGNKRLGRVLDISDTQAVEVMSPTWSRSSAIALISAASFFHVSRHRCSHMPFNAEISAAS